MNRMYIVSSDLLRIRTDTGSTSLAINVALPFGMVTLNTQKPSKIPKILKTIGDHIKKRRLELGLFQMEVASILGVDECTITNWEKNRVAPRLSYIPKIIEFLGYEPEIFTRATPGEKLKRYRKLRGINQEQFARQLGIDPTTLSRMERNQGKLKSKIKRKIEHFIRQFGLH